MRRLVSRYHLLLTMSMLLNVYFAVDHFFFSLSEETRREAKSVTLTLAKHLLKSEYIEITPKKTESLSSARASSLWTTSSPVQTVSATPHSFKEQEETEPARYMLAVLIVTAPANLNRRNTVRNTWMNGYEHRKFYAKFVIGTKNLQDDVLEELQAENSIHNDLLFLPDVEDYYQNLGRKVLSGLVWFDQNVNYSYILKCDDDTFALLDKMEDELHKRDHSRGLYWGYFVGNGYPVKKGIWAETNWKFCDTYFPYAFGGGYVLSADVVHRIAANADAMIVYNNEDVSVGAWTVVYDIERRHDVRFDTGTAKRGCRNTYIVFHKHTVQNMVEKHEQYSKLGVICKIESPLLSEEREYNWNMPPSRCYDKDKDSSELDKNAVGLIKDREARRIFLEQKAEHLLKKRQQIA